MFRSVNMVDHTLPRATISMINYINWDSLVPNFIHDVITSDLNQ